MSTRAFYHRRDMEVDLADLPTWLYREIASLHGQVKRDDAVLTCIGNGEPMYVWRHHSGRFFARHYAGGNGDKHTHLLAAMSDEHRRQAEYTARAAENHGLDTHLEFSTGNGTRLDLAVIGKVNTGFEIQRSALSRAHAKRRTAKSFEAGWPTAWVTDADRAPDWSDHVPTARLTKGIDWTSLPARNTARAVISKYVHERDRTKPTGWGYRGEPIAVLLDDLAYKMPAGDVVPVAVGKQGKVTLAFRDAIDVIESCTFPGAATWRPTQLTPRGREAPQRYSSTCHHQGGASDLREENLGPRCARCSAPLLLIVPGRDLCAACLPQRATVVGLRAFLAAQPGRCSHGYHIEKQGCPAGCQSKGGV